MNKYEGYTTMELLVANAGRVFQDLQLEEEICGRAGLLKEFRDSDDEASKSVLNRAIKILSDREGIKTFSFWAGL